jgi:hypothetical protein
VQLLLKHRASPQQRNTRSGDTALHYVATAVPNNDTHSSNCSVVIRLLCAAGADVCAQNSDQCVPAETCRDASTLQILFEAMPLSKRADIATACVLTAAHRGDAASLRILLDAKACVDEAGMHDSAGVTSPLCAAATAGHANVCKLLLAHPSSARWMHTEEGSVNALLCTRSADVADALLTSAPFLAATPKQRLDLCNLRTDGYASLSLLSSALLRDDAAMVHTLLRHGAVTRVTRADVRFACGMCPRNVQHTKDFECGLLCTVLDAATRLNCSSNSSSSSSLFEYTAFSEALDWASEQVLFALLSTKRHARHIEPFARHDVLRRLVNNQEDDHDFGFDFEDEYRWRNLRYLAMVGFWPSLLQLQSTEVENENNLDNDMTQLAEDARSATLSRAPIMDSVACGADVAGCIMQYAGLRLH